MKKILLVMISVLLLITFVPISANSVHANNYNLTTDTTGSLPTFGNTRLLSDGSFILLGLDNKYYRYDSQMNLIVSKSTSQFYYPITDLSNKRFLMRTSDNQIGIIDVDTGNDILIKDVRNSNNQKIYLSFAVELSNGNIIVKDGQYLYLLDSSLNLIKQISPEVYTVGLVKFQGRTLTVIHDTIKIRSEFAEIDNNGDLIPLGSEFNDYVYSLNVIDNSKIILTKTNSKDYYLYNDKLELLLTGKLDRAFNPNIGGFIPTGDGNIMYIGDINGKYGFSIINQNGESLYSIENSNIAQIQRLSSGRIVMMNSNNSYQIYKTPNGTSTSDVTTIEVPTDLKIAEQDLTLSWRSINNASHYEVVVDNVVEDTNVTSSLYQTNIVNQKLYKFQVAAVDTQGRKTELSEPIYYNYSLNNGGGNSDNEKNENPNATIIGGQLTYQLSDLLFSNITINNDVVLHSIGLQNLSVNDSRGSGAGWSVQLSATDFVSQINNPSGNGTFMIRIPANSVRYQVTTPSVSAGQSVNNLTPTLSGFLNQSPQSLINASPGFGMGIYNTNVDYTLEIPKQLEVFNVTDTNSKIKDGQFVGIYAGVYRSTFTYTMSIGI